MTTVLSRPFSFTPRDDWDVPKADATTWRPKPLPNSNLSPVKNRWIYVFEVKAGKSELFAELKADASGMLAVYSGRDAAAQQKDKRGAPAPTGSAQFRLPHTIQAQRIYHWVFVSRIRLPADLIQKLATEKPVWLPTHDLNVDDTFTATGKVEGQTTVVDSWYLPATDPMNLAETLQRTFESACNALINYTTEFKEQNAAARTAVQQRSKLLILAKMLKAVVESDPEDNLGLTNEFKGSDPLLCKKYIDDYESERKRLGAARDLAGAKLCFCLAEKTFDNLVIGYDVFAEQDMPVWIDFWARVHERMNESPNGRARLGRILDTDPVIKTYILPSGPVSTSVFGVGKECSAAIIGLWREIAPVFILKQKSGGVIKLAEALKIISREDFVEVVSETIKFTKRRKGKRKAFTKVVQRIVPKDPTSKIAHWVKDGAPGKAMEKLTMGVEVVNVLLACYALATVDPDGSTGFAVLNLVGSLLDAVSAFNVLLKFSEKSIKIVGGVSAAIDAVCAVKDGLDAYGKDDLSAAVGFGFVFVGSVLTLAGCTCAAFGIGAATTVVGIPVAVALEILGAILVGAGWLISVFTADSDIEQFAYHCYWGKKNISDSDDKPKWASAAFKEWGKGVEGLNHQLRSLCALLAAYTVKPSDYTAVRVTLGMVGPETRLILHFHCHYNLGIEHEPKIAVDLGDHSATLLSGDAQDLSQIRVSEDKGRIVVSAEAKWPNNPRPSKYEMAIQNQGSYVDVLLDFDGDGKNLLPLSGTALRAPIWGLGRGLSGEVSSLSVR